MLTFKKAHAPLQVGRERKIKKRQNPAKLKSWARQMKNWNANDFDGGGTYGHFFSDGAFLLVAQFSRKNYTLVELVQQLSSRISLGGEITHVGLHDVVDPAPALLQ